MASLSSMQPIRFKSTPNALVFGMNSRNIKVSKTLKFVNCSLDISRLIYHGDFHFTFCIIGTDGMV
jgi:hypothetical protein